MPKKGKKKDKDKERKKKDKDNEEEKVYFFINNIDNNLKFKKIKNKIINKKQLERSER